MGSHEVLQCLVDDGPGPHHDLEPHDFGRHDLGRHDLGRHHDFGPHRSVMLMDWHEILMSCGRYAAMAKMVMDCAEELLD